MKEAEVSIRSALHYIVNGDTEEDVDVAIDGAQAKIKFILVARDAAVTIL